jgi:DNA-binding NarL/FixJ family response regulator
VYQAIRAGASGFLVKDTEPADLIQAVRVVARGDALLSPSVTRRLITDLAQRPERVPPDDRAQLVVMAYESGLVAPGRQAPYG